MGDSEEVKATGPQTQPPSVGIVRLTELAHEFQTLVQGLSLEWSQADETRIALAQVLAERQAQLEDNKERVQQLESRLAALERTQAETGGERERLQADVAAATARAEEVARAQEAERVKAQEDRAGLEAQAAQERARAEELQGRIDAAEKDKESQAQAGARVGELEGRVASLEQELAAERAGTAEKHAQLEAQAGQERTRAEELQGRLDSAEKAAQASAAGASGELEARLVSLEQELATARTRAGELQTQIETREKESAERLGPVEQELAAARARVGELQGQLETRAKESADRLGPVEQDLAAARTRAGELQAQLEAREKELGERVAALERERDEAKASQAQSRPEADELKMQVEGLMRQADGERARWQEERSGIAAERYKALSEAAQLRARVEELEGEAARAKPQASAEAEAAEETRAKLKAAEERGARVDDELATLKAECSLLLEKVDAAEQARVGAEQLRVAMEAERDRAKAETSPLWGTIESLQRQIAQERERYETQLARPPEGGARADVEALERRAAADAQAASAAQQRAEQAEAELVQLRERSDATASAFKSALQAVRRTPFVPPTLRVAFNSLEDEVAPAAARKPTRGMRLLFLDRDPLSVEPLANDLEQHGTEVQVAHYAEEVTFFLKTPEAKNVTAVVADVMCFRGDQDMIERYKAWRQEAPNVTLVVSYRADNPIEAERARNAPANLGAIHVARTIGREALLDALSKRTAGKGEPAGLFRRFKR